MVFPLKDWRPLFLDIVQKACPFNHVLFLLAQLCVALILGSTVNYSESVNANHAIANLDELCPLGDTQLNLLTYLRQYFGLDIVHKAVQ